MTFIWSPGVILIRFYGRQAFDLRTRSLITFDRNDRMLGVIERSLPLERVTETESALQVPGYRRQLREFVILRRFITPFASTFLALSIFIFVHVLFHLLRLLSCVYRVPRRFQFF